MAPTPRPVSGLPLRPGTAGEAVRDIQRRLAALGYDLPAADAGFYGEATGDAIERFQESRGLRVDGICGPQTWASLVEAGYRLGDRFLYLRAPMLRGDDVAELQRLLGLLGFDAGRVDGIFGPRTGRALADFQRNAGLTTDGICGADTVSALRRLGAKSGQTTTVAKLREQEVLLGAPRSLLGRRVAIGEAGGLAALAEALGRLLVDGGATVEVLHHPDGSAQAAEANDFKAEVYLGIALLGEPGCAVSYFAVDEFESVGGKRLAELVQVAVPPAVGAAACSTRGMRLPVLRETRMPAVVCELGPASAVVEHSAAVVQALGFALRQWIELPFGT